MKKQFTLYILIPILIIVFSILCAIYTNDFLVGGITLLCGFFNAYYMAIGKWYNYIFGIVFSIAYGYTCFSNGLYGFAIFTIIIYTPLQIYGLFTWKSKQIENQVKMKSLNYKYASILCFCIVAGSFLLGFLLDLIPTQNFSFLDSSSQILNLCGIILITYRFRESWYIWLVNNTIDLVIWIINSVNSTPYSNMMLITAIMYLIMNILGLISWIKIEKKQTQMSNLSINIEK